jgi:Tfp pilus assembly protein PilV
MTYLIAVAALLLLGVGLLALVGARSRTIFTNPSALSDQQLAAIIDLTQRIMDRAPPNSSTWMRAAGKHKAAVDEQARRRGEAPFDNIELVDPD